MPRRPFWPGVSLCFDMSGQSPSHEPLVDDFVLPFQLENVAVRGRLVRLGAALDDILHRHDLPDPIAVLLGKALLMAALFGSALKQDTGRLTLQIQGDGPVSLLIADYHARGSLRGLARFLPEAIPDVSEAVTDETLLGKGHLALTLDPGEGERYQGIVALAEGGLETAAHHYFQQSEQLPTFLRLAVARHAVPSEEGGRVWRWRGGGLMVQNLARSPRSAWEDEDGWERARILASTVQAHELLDPLLPADRLLYRLFHEEGVRSYQPIPIREACHCSRERIEKVLASFSPEERQEMIKDGVIQVTCDFCNRRYDFDPNALSLGLKP